jgi:hypothetical protein
MLPCSVNTASAGALPCRAVLEHISCTGNNTENACNMVSIAEVLRRLQRSTWGPLRSSKKQSLLRGMSSGVLT